MNYMKKLINYLSLISLFIIFDFIEAQGETSNKTILMQENLTKDFGPPILKPNNFSMNQSFSLSTLFNNNTTQTIGVFSNFTNHELSEKLNLKTGLHLIYGNNLAFPSKSNMEYSYEIALDYKINSNTFFNITLLKHSNQNNPQPLDSFKYATK